MNPLEKYAAKKGRYELTRADKALTYSGALSTLAGSALGAEDLVRDIRGRRALGRGKWAGPLTLLGAALSTPALLKSIKRDKEKKGYAWSKLAAVKIVGRKVLRGSTHTPSRLAKSKRWREEALEVLQGRKKPFHPERNPYGVSDSLLSRLMGTRKREVRKWEGRLAKIDASISRDTARTKYPVGRFKIPRK